MSLILQQFAVLILFFSFKISAIQFGFIIRDSEIPSLNGKFIAFGLVPSISSSKIKSEMIDFVNLYLQEEYRKRDFEGIERKSFIADPLISSATQNGKSLVGLKGELSTFLNLLRYSCKKLIPAYESTWSNAVFLFAPTILVDFDQLSNFSGIFEFFLDDFVFIEDQSDEIYESIIKRNSSLTPSESESLIPSEPATTRSSSVCKSCCCCVCF